MSPCGLQAFTCAAAADHEEVHQPITVERGEERSEQLHLFLSDALTHQYLVALKPLHPGCVVVPVASPCGRPSALLLTRHMRMRVVVPGTLGCMPGQDPLALGQEVPIAQVEEALDRRRRRVGHAVAV
jgi:hypothetical protein